MPQRRTAIKDYVNLIPSTCITADQDWLKKDGQEITVAVSDKKTDAKELLKEIYKKFDKAAKRNVMHKKTAARRKSRFARL